jgi:hypothetical protein
MVARGTRSKLYVGRLGTEVADGGSALKNKTAGRGGD